MNFLWKVYIIVLNWNGWKDTIECLNSIIESDYSNYEIIICDNASSDNSILEIEKWRAKKKVEVILLKNNSNLGFAGGNNVGIRYALGKGDFKYIWILNNDTVVKRNTLSALVRKMESDNTIGICGSKLMYYDNSDEVQALGGQYNKLLGISKHIIREEDLCKLDYVVGASMLISKKFIEEIGLMNDCLLYTSPNLSFFHPSFRPKCPSAKLCLRKRQDQVRGRPARYPG